MSGQGSGGRASGGKGSGGIGRSRGSGETSGRRNHSGGVRLPPPGEEAVVRAESGPVAPRQGVIASPSPGYVWRSGASEHDEFFYPNRPGDPSAQPAATPPASGSAGRLSAGQRGSVSPAVSSPASLERLLRRKDEALQKGKETALAITNQLVDEVDVLREAKKKAASTIAEQEKILGDKEESIKALQDQLAAAMSQLHAKDTTIQQQQQQIQALSTPVGSQTGDASPGMSTGSVDVLPRQRSRELTPLPPRPRGPIPPAIPQPRTPYQKSRWGFSANSSDDVFGEGVVSPTPNQKARAATDGQRPLQELLSTCFNKGEAAIRQVPILNLVPKDNGRPTYNQNQIIKLLQGHLGTAKLAYELLKDDEGRYQAIIGLMSHTFVDYILTEQIIGTDANFAGQAYLKAFEDEYKAAQYGHPRIQDLQYRNGLAEQRASSARALVRTQGFWKWLNSTIYGITEGIVNDFAVCFPANSHYALTQELNKAVSEAVRIAVRMRQEPNYIEFNFPPTGTPWNSLFHVHRNPELMGQTLTDEKSPHCVRIALMPLIKSKSFANNMVDLKTILKAEVIVGDRETHMRQARRQR